MESGFKFNSNDNSSPTVSSPSENSSGLNNHKILPVEMSSGKNRGYNGSLSYLPQGNGPSMFQGLHSLYRTPSEYEWNRFQGTRQQDLEMFSHGSQDTYLYSHYRSGNDFSERQSTSSASLRNKSNERLNYFTQSYLSSVGRSNKTESSNPLSNQLPQRNKNICKGSHPYNQKSLGSVSVKIEGLYSPTKLIRKEFRTNGVLHKQSGKTESTEMDHELSENDSNKQRFTDSLARQPHEGESCMSQDFYSKPQQTSENGSSPIQEANLHEDESTKSPSSHSFPNNSSAKGYLKNKDSPTLPRIMSNSGVNMHQELQSDDGHIFVAEPVHCGAVRLIKTLARNSQIETPSTFGMALKKTITTPVNSFTINAWHMQNLIRNLRTCLEFSRSAIVLVYDVTGYSCVSALRRLIPIVQYIIRGRVPIFLVGNTSDVKNPSALNVSGTTRERLLSADFGVILKNKYGLSDFRECSIESDAEVDALILNVIYLGFGYNL
ncbi:hypothetical protein AVEN_26691-1 [Araneus ventricosus]|uniref:Uncharacterized protein n=1 Tax=Araneus ventricosus TaxID=182803 RepID=A0A4Y2RJS5_ARAVE|nr:hypothetical protein AVEN_26691-1 [Araneus ventricosus]